jgi:AcrR family transcriptional regulator
VAGNQRELQRLETRRLLARHAVRLFAERGFDETTVEDIASAVGVSPRTFFLHFATKANAAFPDHAERVERFVDRIGDGSVQPNPMRHLCQALVSGLDTTTPMRRERYRLLASVPALRDEDARTDRDYEDAVVAYLLQAWGSTPETRIRAQAVANAMLGVVRAVLIGWAEEGLDPKLVCAEVFERMFLSPFDSPLQSLHQS